MKFARIGPAGSEIPVVVDVAGQLRDLRPITADLDGSFWADGPTAVRDALDANSLPVVPADGIRFGPPIPSPGKIVCIGLNYRQHAIETNAEIPNEPVLFMKAPDVIVGPDDEVLIPRGSTQTDYEVELGVVIGREARYVESAEDALACIAGYVVSHDVSEREFQLARGGTWDKGKSCETFNPLGPYVVTPDEVDPTHLDLRLWVNGELRQSGSTSDMIFDVATIIQSITRYLVLRPGDLMNTGTPHGVAIGSPDPKPFLRAGDVVELEIAGVGRQRQRIGAA